MTEHHGETAGILAALSNELVAAVERAAQSVVRIDARRRSNPASGIIWTADGLILTAEHVLEREEDITIGLGDRRELPATIVGRDPGTDLALLRVQSGDLTPIERGATPKVGHLVLAVGRPSTNVAATAGIVSALGGPVRTWRGGQLEGFIRTDAPLFPGLSGGPLIDASGRMVALATSHFGRGIGFGILIETVTRVADALLQQGRVRRGYLGITSQPVPLPPALQQKLGLTQETGLMVISVEPGTPAERGGLLLGDILIGLDGQPVRDTDDLPALLTSDRVGKATPVQVIRGGELRVLTVIIGERP